MRLTVSIVTYQSDPELFEETLAALGKAVVYARKQIPALGCSLSIIENEPLYTRNRLQAEQYLLPVETSHFDEVFFSTSSNNLGYGCGHNTVIDHCNSDFHLVLNPDVILSIDALGRGLDYLIQNPQAVLVTPFAIDEKGRSLHLCKRYPVIFDLLLRGFAPRRFKQRFQHRLSIYEMHELDNIQEPVSGIPIVSGCCMLTRTIALKACGGFDKQYFMYFEDFDLSLRLHEKGEIVYLPAMHIVHYGGHAAKKGLRHVRMFSISALKFYQRHGWKIL